VGAVRSAIILDSGRVVADGPVKGLLADEQLLVTHGLELPLAVRLGGSGVSRC